MSLKNVYTPGVWDLLHPGHLNLLSQASSLGDKLMVGVCSDRLVRLHKGKLPVMDQESRRLLVASLKMVDEAFIYDDPDQSSVLRQLGISVFVVGDQFGSQGVPEHQNALNYCSENGVDLLRIPRTSGISSSDIKEWVIRNRKESSVSDFWMDRGQRLHDGKVDRWQATSLTKSPEAAVKRKESDWEAIHQVIERIPDRLKRVVELGCGTGRITQELAKITDHVTGIDFVPEFIKQAQIDIASDNVEFICADCTSIDNPSQYDACIMSGLLNYLDDHQLEELIDRINVIPYIILKESVGTFGRFSLTDDHYSEQLQSSYQSIYRSVGEIIDIMSQFGYISIYSAMVQKHRKETHMNAFLFQKK